MIKDDYAVRVSLEDWRRVPHAERQRIYEWLARSGRAHDIEDRHTQAAVDALMAITSDV